MELGGLAPFVVFPTADLDKAVEGLMVSKFRNTGKGSSTRKSIRSNQSNQGSSPEIKLTTGWSKETWKGQTCVCANNIMVHEDVHDEFIAKVKVAVETQLKFGDAYNGATQGNIDVWIFTRSLWILGAMINEGGIAKVEEHIADALKRGATLVTGGKRLSGSGWFPHI